ncbi:hypothetical protein P256_00042 [Acinetobacter nectaris CIP 110549]|uniref:Uncharacterized protein n=1 Tax=Acinetobacter nectaris CIP 110549 TaxID=1392540 RepID=V2TXB5_9GAMM|nr:hypothetical protein [Acinetobacter nectaris]ESK40280.1 hypothetical protein P256_00727 [Acinetobacter nectaris CIP 110549]ESK41057.1 hypothetical protein P256_00042 [Acinetobacter nectaris CIP 110549]
MKANEFIKKAGLNEVKRLLSTATVANDNQVGVIPYNPFIGIPIDIGELKRLIESYELVGSFGGLEHAKCFLAENIPCADSGVLNKAIADVESCQ